MAQQSDERGGGEGHGSAEFGPKLPKVCPGGKRAMAGAYSIADHGDGRFRLAFVEPGVPKRLGGGVGVEGRDGHGRMMGGGAGPVNPACCHLLPSIPVPCVGMDVGMGELPFENTA